MNGIAYSLRFGPFTLDFPELTLAREGGILRLGRRATDILVALVEARGELVSRDALIARVWPDTVVDEGALRVHLSAVRKVLGDGTEGIQYISNEPGRGYRFVATVTRSQSSEPQVASWATDTGHNLPGQITRILGRADIIERLLKQLLDRRCLTVAGPGGIGKTTVAIALAHRFVADSFGRACFVDLAPLSDASSVPSALATALGIPLSGHDPVKEIVASLGDEPLLLLLDNCEHLIEPVATLVEKLLQEAPGIRMLVTSREPLRAAGEWIHRLASLPTPTAGMQVSAEQALSFPAIRLFVDRATAVRDNFQLDERNVSAVCDICLRLDGIPLAIEFAAARADWLDVQAIAEHLDARFKLLTKGRRTALPRHQTLRATLDWSYDLLDSRSQAVLRSISLFRTSFDMTAMLSVAACTSLDEVEILEAASDLVAKSLLTCDVSAGDAQYRLLDTTRYYGMELLEASGVANAAKLRHASYCGDLFVETEQAWDGDATRARLDLHSRRIDDIRAALDWALGDDGDAGIGINLVVVSSFLWFHLSIASEFISIAEKALDVIEKTQLQGTSLHVDLLSVYGQAHWPSCGPTQTMFDAFELALEISLRLGDQAQEMRAIWGLWIHQLLNGFNAISLRYAEDFHAKAVDAGSQGTISTGINMIALSLHFIGDADGAVKYIEMMLSDDSAPGRITHANAAQIDGYLSAQGNLMLFKWLQGSVGIALDVARAAAEEAVVLDHDLSICAVLATGGVPVAFWSGDLELAASMTAVLRDRAQRRGMRYWDRWGEGFESALKGQSMDLRDATMMQIETFATMGLTCALDDLESKGRHFDESWAQPELLRRRAERSDDPLGDEAVANLELSLDVARRQTARAWQLRTALSLAKVRKARGEGEQARAALEEILSSFTDGFNQADVIAATHFLQIRSA